MVLVHVQRLIESMNNANVDAIVYPTWSDPPRLIGDYYNADGKAPLAFRLPCPSLLASLSTLFLTASCDREYHKRRCTL